MRTFIFRSSNVSLAVPSIIFFNVVVYIMWLFSSGAEGSFMVQNFLVSWQGLSQGRLWTLLSSVYSHNMFFHLFINMYILKGFGPIVERTIGYKSFMRFYWSAGIISSLSHSAVSAFLMDQPGLPALGASGAVAGVILLFCLFYPREKILIFGLIPVPALMGALFVVGLDLWGLTAQMGGHGLPIGHGAHLGGAFTGLIYYLLFWRGHRRRQQEPRAPQRTATGAEVIDVDYERL